MINIFELVAKVQRREPSSKMIIPARKIDFRGKMV